MLYKSDVSYHSLWSHLFCFLPFCRCYIIVFSSNLINKLSSKLYLPCSILFLIKIAEYVIMHVKLYTTLQRWEELSELLIYFWGFAEYVLLLLQVVRGDFIVFFNQIFDALCKLSADVDANVQSAAHLLDRLVKVFCIHNLTSWQV